MKSWNENSGWKDDYKKLEKYLRLGIDGKRYRDKWHVKHECDYCGLAVTVDSKNYKDNKGYYNYYAQYLECQNKRCKRYNFVVLRPRVQGCRCENYYTYYKEPFRPKADKTQVIPGRCPLHVYYERT